MHLVYGIDIFVHRFVCALKKEKKKRKPNGDGAICHYSSNNVIDIQ